MPTAVVGMVLEQPFPIPNKKEKQASLFLLFLTVVLQTINPLHRRKSMEATLFVNNGCC